MTDCLKGSTILAQGGSRSAPWPWALMLQAFSLFSADHSTFNIEIVTFGVRRSASYGLRLQYLAYQPLLR